jgi:predicted HTH domain antitoxin
LREIEKIFIRYKVENINMYSSESLQKVLVPKYYKNRDALIEDAFRALLNLKPGLKVEIGVELYLKEEVSLSKAAEIAGMDIESFKEMMKARGLKIRSYIGSKEEIERGLRLI